MTRLSIAVIWGNTVKAVEEYPDQFTRTEHMFRQV